MGFLWDKCEWEERMENEIWTEERGSLFFYEDGFRVRLWTPYGLLLTVQAHAITMKLSRHYTYNTIWEFSMKKIPWREIILWISCSEIYDLGLSLLMDQTNCNLPREQSSLKFWINIIFYYVNRLLYLPGLKVKSPNRREIGNLKSQILIWSFWINL